MANEYPHLAVDASPGLKKLALGSFPAIEKKEFRTPPHENTWKIPKFVRDASAGPKKRY
jgi:hypothetical protein